ncbi:SpoIIE family protein phosphatase [bacterium]|nr:SpoIIE family protein phosphatase [bacterium]
MKITKIQHKILLLLSIILVFSLGTSLLMVWRSVSSNLEVQISKDLNAKFNLIEVLLRAEEVALKKQVSLLSEEPTLKMSLQTADAITIQDTSSQLQEMVQNDLFLVLSEELKIMSVFPKKHGFKDLDQVTFFKEVLDGDLDSSIWIVSGKTYLLAASSVEFHDFVIGIVIVGKELGDSLTRFLSEKSKSPVSIYSKDQLLSSSWGAGFQKPKSNKLKVENTIWQGKSFQFKVNQKNISFYLQSSYSHIMALLNEISLDLFLLGLAIFMIALLFSYVFSKQLIRPIKALMQSAKDLQEGHFDHEVKVDSHDELFILGKSFESMRLSLIEQREELIKTEAMKKDLELAARIQISLLPKTCPQRENIQFDAKLLPSSHIGGDYYGYFTEPKDGFGVIIADVSGHGAASAILMAMARSVLLSQVSLHDQPAKLLQFVNRVLYDDLEEAECFISMFYFFYNEESKELKYSNAGHNRPLYYNGESYSELDTDGMLIGILDDAEYEEKSIIIEKEQFLVLYTDGLTEPHNQAGEEFSIERLKSHFLKDQDNLVQSLYDDVDDFAGENAYYDDRTCVYMKLKS